MSIPSRLSNYLARRGASYEVQAHDPSRTSAETARTAQVLPHQLAKSVILGDDDGCVMAVVPADRMVRIGQLASLLGRHELHLADEEQIAELFDGCERGAVPPVGMAWGIETIVDDELENIDVVYLEAGDHEHLLRLDHAQFHALMAGVRHERIARKPVH